MHQNLIVIDTETGGLSPEHHSILSLGFVAWSGGEISHEGEVLINEPELNCDEEALSVNRISPERIENEGLTPAAAVDKFEQFLAMAFPLATRPKSITIAGHNVWFDVAFLRRLYAIAGRTYPVRLSHRLLDTSSVLQLLRLTQLEGLGSGSSDMAFERFGVTILDTDRHTGLGDARATANLITALVQYLNKSFQCSQS